MIISYLLKFQKVYPKNFGQIPEDGLDLQLDYKYFGKINNF